MRYLKIVCIAWIFIFSMHNVSPVFADDFEENNEYYAFDGDNVEHEDELYEDIGKLIGWLALVTIGAAGLLFPARKILKSIITTFPQLKQLSISFTKFIGKHHILIGLTALVLSIGHGIIMYLNEGEWDSEGITGVAAVIILMIAAIIGIALSKKKKVKKLRSAHTMLVSFGILVVILHVIFL